MPKADSCEYCPGALKSRRVHARFPYRRGIIYVDQVPAWVCERCGEQYFNAAVVKRLEEIARRRGRIKRKISFPLAQYDMALTR